ncbi:MAG: choice-of-anchor N protein [Gammaproteobacteria bacterium]|nr:choice-of-anchor N protein [Gammaproteobacteria bacterium]
MKNQSFLVSPMRWIRLTGAAIWLIAFVFAQGALAVPVLQVGVSDGSGGYVDYQATLTNPTETDTAVVSGDSLSVLFAGVYGPNTLNLGGQYGSYGDYGDVRKGQVYPYAPFNGHGAVAVLSIPDGTLADAAGLKLSGISPFLTTTTLSGLFPNNHDPLKDDVSDYLFFDIGTFAKNSGAVPDFADETGAADGEIKSFLLSGFESLAWIHFDVVALETTSTGQNIATSFNPPSHDVTFKPSEPGDPTNPPAEIPTPAPLALLGISGLIAALRMRRRRNA